MILGRPPVLKSYLGQRFRASRREDAPGQGPLMVVDNYDSFTYNLSQVRLV